jgi:hypothetical protein
MHAELSEVSYVLKYFEMCSDQREQEQEQESQFAEKVEN